MGEGLMCKESTGRQAEKASTGCLVHAENAPQQDGRHVMYLGLYTYKSYLLL